MSAWVAFELFCLNARVCLGWTPDGFYIFSYLIVFSSVFLLHSILCLQDYKLRWNLIWSKNNCYSQETNIASSLFAQWKRLLRMVLDKARRYKFLGIEQGLVCKISILGSCCKVPKGNELLYVCIWVKRAFEGIMVFYW